MLKIIEKTFGRQILVDVVDMATRLTPIGFETDRPNINYVRMPYGKYGVQVKGTEALDVVVRQDNVVVAQRRLEAGVVHIIHRGDDGKPLFFAAPGQKPKFVADDAGQPIVSDGEAAAEKGESLFPELEFELPYAESFGLVIVQVRFAHVKPDYGPELPPDDFTSILYQFNEPKAHLKAMSQNFGKVKRPDVLPLGANELGDQRNLVTPRDLPPVRVCAIACDRDHAHTR